MTQKSVMEYMRGKIYWAKIFGPPRPNYNGDAREWTLEFEPDETGVETLASHGLKDRLKDQSHKKGYEKRAPFLNLKRKEFRNDGEENEHIRVVDANNGSWPDNTKIGNETIGDVKVKIVDYGPGKKKGIYPIAIRVMSLVPYKSNEFAPVDKNDPFFEEAKKLDTFAKDFGLDEQEATPEPKPSRTKKVELTEDELNDDIPM